MGLSVDNDGGGGAPKETYTDKGRVTKITPYYDENPDWMGREYDADKANGRPQIGIEIEYEPEGRDLDFDPSIYIDGLLEIDAEGRVTGWGSAFKVKEALYELLGPFELTDDNKIPKKALEEAIGQPIVVLQYVSDRKASGKYKYRNFRRITSPARNDAVESDAEERLRLRFENAVADGYVYEYNPQLLKNGSSGGGNLSTGDGPREPQETFEPDDELPF